MQCKGEGKKPKTTQLCVFTNVNYLLLLASIHSLQHHSKRHWSATVPMELLPKVMSDTTQGQAGSKQAIWFPPAPTSGKLPSLVSTRMTHLLRIRERKGHHYAILGTGDKCPGTFQGRKDSRIHKNQRNWASSA